MVKEAADIFGPALEALVGCGGVIFGPVSFQAYLAQHKLPLTTRTAAAISIDSYARLPLSLKRTDTMVLRLGVPAGASNTQFLLVRVTGKLKDWFLFDSEYFTDSAGSTFLPEVSFRRLYAYKLLPAYAETSLMNLALSSGILSAALELDGEPAISAPATGQSTFSFEFRPHSSLSVMVKHSSGQVQMDAVLVERRKGQDCVFVLEAKTGSADRSLAKHKLVYGVLALAKHVPRDMAIVPVYLRIAHAGDDLHFYVAECDLPDPRLDVPAIDQLTVRKHAHLVLRGFK